MAPIFRTHTAKVVAALLLPAVALSQPASGTDPAARYTMQQTDNGMLRLDTHTGVMSLCSARNGAWACVRIEDDSSGLDSELRALKSENRRLRDRIAQLESDTGRRSSQGSTGLRGFSEIPSEEEVDKAFTFLEGIIRRFRGLAEDLQDKPTNGTPL